MSWKFWGCFVLAFIMIIAQILTLLYITDLQTILWTKHKLSTWNINYTLSRGMIILYRNNTVFLRTNIFRVKLLSYMRFTFWWRLPGSEKMNSDDKGKSFALGFFHVRWPSELKKLPLIVTSQMSWLIKTNQQVVRWVNDV